MWSISLNKWLIIIPIVFIIINNILWVIAYRRKKTVISKPSSYKEITDDLMQIINYKCFVARRRVLQPLVDKALKNTPLINDSIVNKLTVQITKELLDELSPEYLKKLKSIYKEEVLEDILLELVYNVITEMSRDINKKSIKKMNRINVFKSFTKNDIDSEDEDFIE